MQPTYKSKPKTKSLIEQALGRKSRDYILVDKNKDRKKIKREAFDLRNQLRSSRNNQKHSRTGIKIPFQLTEAETGQ
jgi:hypothetical protein